ncbi:MAG: BolA/IbaG family iron-sulfur metabolism protein [Chromatiaceae bacterium]|nr:BolA/IbaG family iron-sulfur metabolism protein [Gammaproteobacteria bacterium]MCP5301281.1 BolA/IbaG family iron-sulfur metabolism protein [Chromatiaceae bacterium]MCP5421953.1 BolA/IbaG family iron-sulfur metabolism protein [Chromatiaceae bacterium]
MDMQQQIEQRLRESFAPLHLEVQNESHMHNVPEGSQSHFRVVLVSDRFDGKPLLQRHRAVNGTLSDELAGGIHALALHTMTPEEWFAKGGEAPQSPPCLGGGKA